MDAKKVVSRAMSDSRSSRWDWDWASGMWIAEIGWSATIRHVTFKLSSTTIAISPTVILTQCIIKKATRHERSSQQGLIWLRQSLRPTMDADDASIKPTTRRVRSWRKTVGSTDDRILLEIHYEVGQLFSVEFINPRNPSELEGRRRLRNQQQVRQFAWPF